MTNHVNQSEAVNSGRRSTHDYITTIHNQNTIKGNIRKNGTMSTTKWNLGVNMDIGNSK